MSRSGGMDDDTPQRIRKTKGVFAHLTSIWRSTQLKRGTKPRLFGTNVTSVLFYGWQTWKITKFVSVKLKVFINRCLRRILNGQWPDRIANEELWRREQVPPVTEIIKTWKYEWIRHMVLSLTASNNISCQAMEWNPHGN